MGVITVSKRDDGTVEVRLPDREPIVLDSSVEVRALEAALDDFLLDESLSQVYADEHLHSDLPSTVTHF